MRRSTRAIAAADRYRWTATPPPGRQGGHEHLVGDQLAHGVRDVRSSRMPVGPGPFRGRRRSIGMGHRRQEVQRGGPGRGGSRAATTTQRSSYRRSRAERRGERLGEQHTSTPQVREHRVVEPGDGFASAGRVRGALGHQAGEAAAEDVRRRLSSACHRDRACRRCRVETGQRDDRSGLRRASGVMDPELGAARGERHSAALAHEEFVV